MEPATATARQLSLHSLSPVTCAPIPAHLELPKLTTPRQTLFTPLHCAAIGVPHSLAPLFLEPQINAVLRTPSALLPARKLSFPGLHTRLAHPKSATGLSASPDPPPLCLEGHRPQPSLAQSPLPAPRLSSPGSANTKAVFPSPPRPRGPLYLQL